VLLRNDLQRGAQSALALWVGGAAGCVTSGAEWCRWVGMWVLQGCYVRRPLGRRKEACSVHHGGLLMAVWMACGCVSGIVADVLQHVQGSCAQWHGWIAMHSSVIMPEVMRRC
jgi:hypothetical protein